MTASVWPRLERSEHVAVADGGERREAEVQAVGGRRGYVVGEHRGAAQVVDRAVGERADHADHQIEAQDAEHRLDRRPPSRAQAADHAERDRRRSDGDEQAAGEPRGARVRGAGERERGDDGDEDRAGDHRQPHDPHAHLARLQRQDERARAQRRDQGLLPRATGRDALDEEQHHQRREQQAVAFPQHPGRAAPRGPLLRTIRIAQRSRCAACARRAAGSSSRQDETCV